ncbi:hypothetical protein B0T26DRAFT_736508 [Lasiosphaeria miniovina]|uniref:Reticulocyte-binding protein 2-like protein a n=1 Tax=Lasiosphaeria miniovina TaxID=1954250 RepID=A0AA40BG35_9PEZI|nr:uncharacterized protein B0T26DRAFT_736508 [Lasiosphaeria miniovina]KAK0733603.1 hypothetical protein B0T26DRAFT_736508 [Lasiosphaeria miniovina]
MARDRSPGPRRGPPPPPPNPHYIQTVTRDVRDTRPTGYYNPGPSYLQPERTVVTTRSRSRERRSTPPQGPPAQVAPVVIHNIQNRFEHSDSEYSSDESSHVSRHRHGHGHGHRSHSRVHSRRSSSSHSYIDDAKDKWELERTREQLKNLQLTRQKQDEQAAADRYYKEEVELVRARTELGHYRQEEEIRKLDEKYKADSEARQAKEELSRIRRQNEEDKSEKQRREEEDLRRAKAELERRKRHDEDERLEREYKEEEQLRRAKAELEAIRKAEDKKHEEERIRREIELKKLEEDKKRREEEERKKKEAEDAIAAYKAKELERQEKEKKEKEAADKEYQRRLQEHLIKSGLDEKEIAAILENKKIKRKKEEEEEEERGKSVARPTYTRMSLRHLDIETLHFYKLDWEYDAEPGYILIKRWVPEQEQAMLWEHTRRIRVVTQKREKDVVLKIKDKSSDDDKYEWVRKTSHSRRRSKSPGLLMYLAGARPA